MTSTRPTRARQAAGRPQPPDTTGTSARRLWDAVTGAYDLDEHELATLRAACGTLDVVDQLEAVLATAGLMTTDGQGTPKVHPAVAELRQQRMTYARLLAALRVPDDTDAQAAGVRLQRRVGVRRPYGKAPAAIA